jgi:hypothetical protein
LIKIANTFILNPTAIKKNDELRKFIIGKDDFEYATHTLVETILQISVAQSSRGDRVRKNN